MTLWDFLASNSSVGFAGFCSALGAYVGVSRDNKKLRRAIELALVPYRKRIEALERAQGWVPRSDSTPEPEEE